MTIAGRRYGKRTEAAAAMKDWMRENVPFRPLFNAVREAGIVASIAGHDIRVVEGAANPANLALSRVELHIDGAPGVSVETSREGVMNPTSSLMTRLENQIQRLPDTVTKHEHRIEEARQGYRDETAALGQPFKHDEALKEARWTVERIDRVMKGEDDPQPTFDDELAALRRQQRSDFPVPIGTRTPSATNTSTAEPLGAVPAAEVARTGGQWPALVRQWLWAITPWSKHFRTGLKRRSAEEKSAHPR